MSAPHKTNLLPPPSEEEYEALKASIAKHGFWKSSPVTVDEKGDILDGHTRARACGELGIEYPTIVVRGLNDWEKIERALVSNIARRNLTPAQRRPLIKRLTEEYDKFLRAEGEKARKAGNAKGGRKSSTSQTRLAEATPEDTARAAAADAAQTRFDEPVVAEPRPKVDRLDTIGKMVGVSRSTVANDEKILDRIEKIETEARRQKRDDVLRMLDKPRPNLDELERAVGLRAPLPPVEEPDADRLGWVDNLAQALNNLAPALSDDEADRLWSKAANQALLIVQLGQVRGAAAEAKARAGK